MTNLISRAIAHISTLLEGLQVKQFFAAGLVAFLLLTTNVDIGKNDQPLPAKLRDRIEQNNTDRPKTTGQWNREARKVEGKPGERVKRIGKESAEAFKEFGSGYVEGAGKTADQIGDAANRAATDLTN